MAYAEAMAVNDVEEVEWTYIYRHTHTHTHIHTHILACTHVHARAPSNTKHHAQVVKRTSKPSITDDFPKQQQLAREAVLPPS
jgi:hypothetical protein